MKKVVAKGSNGLKESFFAAWIFNFSGIACFAAGGHEIGLGLLVIGGIFSLLFVVFAIDVFSEIVSISRKLDNATKKMDVQIEVLNDINRHICDGFNGIAEMISSNN